MRAASDAGAGDIGAYTHCSFQTRVKGSFPPGQGANPVIGRVGSLEYAEEVKLEMVTPESIIGCVIEAVIGVHPYEEVAYDIIPLSNPGEKRGRGRIGELESKAPLSSLLQIIREKIPRMRHSPIRMRTSTCRQALHCERRMGGDLSGGDYVRRGCSYNRHRLRRRLGVGRRIFHRFGGDWGGGIGKRRVNRHQGET